MEPSLPPSSIVPMVIENTGRIERAFDIFSLLLRERIWPDWGPSQLHMLHRFGGVATGLVVIATALVCARSARRHGQRLALRLAIAAPLIVAMQFLLGVLTVTSNIGVVQATAHLGVGAALLADFVTMWFALGPQAAGGHAPSSSTPSSALRPHEAVS